MPIYNRIPIGRFLSGILLGVLFFEIILRAISPVLGPPLRSWNTMQDAKLYLLSRLQGQQVPENFIFGNSTALVGVVPKEIEESTGLRFFNAAMNGSDTYSMMRLATDEIIPLYGPKRIFFFLSQGSFRIDPQVSDHPYNIAQPLRKEHSFISDRISTLYIFKYRNMIRDPMLVNTLVRSLLFFSTEQGIVQRWAADLDNFGYSTLPQSLNSIQGGWRPDKGSKMEMAKPILPLGTERDFQTLIKAAARNGVQVFLVTVPTLNFDDEYREKARELAIKYGLNFIQGNDAIRDGKFFQDEVHLNKQGAHKFSLWLAEAFVSRIKD